MEAELHAVQEILQTIKCILFDMKWTRQLGLMDRLDGMFNEFDASFKKLQKNLFFQVFLMPINRVQYELLYGQVEFLRLEKNMDTKATKLAVLFGEFIFQCDVELKRLLPLYQRMKHVIESHSVDTAI